MFFTDDIALINETRAKTNLKKLELWRSALEFKGLRLTINKTEYMHCSFSNVNDGGSVVGMHGAEVPESDHCWYQGSIMQKEGDIKEILLIKSK